MKELSIEQKAKRFDEAVEKLRRLHDDYDTVSTLIDIKEELENIFPELKKSEDEKIRKALKEYFINSFQNNGVAAICGVHIKDILNWLEKQGEYTPIVMIPKFRVGSQTPSRAFGVCSSV